MAKTLVLGASGFIGGHLVDALVAEGHSVRAFGRFRDGHATFSGNNIEVVNGDFLNRSDLVDALAGIEYVFHFISSTTPATAENDPLIDIDTNIRTSVDLMTLCVEYGVKRIIYASSGGTVYGFQKDQTVCSETTTVPQPVSPYGIGKQAVENYLRYFNIKHDLDSVVFRISNPYGERQPFHRRQGVIPIFLENIFQNKQITVLGNGTMVRDYIYVKDVARIIASIFTEKFQHSTYNLGSGRPDDLNTIIKCAKKVTGKNVHIVHQRAPSTFIHTVQLDTARLMSEFKLAPLTTLEDGMKNTYQYIEAEMKI